MSDPSDFLSNLLGPAVDRANMQHEAAVADARRQIREVENMLRDMPKNQLEAFYGIFAATQLFDEQTSSTFAAFYKGLIGGILVAKHDWSAAGEDVFTPETIIGGDS